MTTKKSALGKGLGALISDIDEINRRGRFTEYEGNEHEDSSVSAAQPSETSNTNPASISDIPVDKIVTNPFQPRTSFDEAALDDLAESIKLLGLIQPITVRCIGSQYQIISGERRFRAAKRAGITHIPAYIRKADDQGMLEMAIVENIQREDLDSIEIALSFQRLLEECHITQESMADRIGKKRTTITNYLRLLKLPIEIQSALRRRQITMGHAKSILSLSSVDQQIKLCNLIIKKDLSVRQTESKIKEILKTDNPQDQSLSIPEDLPESYYRLLEILGKCFENNISLKRSSSGKGSLNIKFSSDSEIEQLLKNLTDK